MSFTIYSKVILPLCGPVLAAQAIFTFTFVWNDFFWPLIVISSSRAADLTTWIGAVYPEKQDRLGCRLCRLGDLDTTGSAGLHLLPEIFHPWHRTHRDEVTAYGKGSS